ncbi:MAG TPA: efflux RND transporter periplasmic adaptor subunit [Armatimonadota bacterium]|nr:efflux RND transporter periplasmic adaptor subunit [Armatimonadota bacterium]
MRQNWIQRRPRWFWIVILASLLAILVVVLIIVKGQTTVIVTRVTRGQAITAVYAPGTVLSGTQTTISTNAAGRLTGVYVDRGSKVITGQIIANIDDSQARLQLRAAESDLHTAEAQFAETSEPGDPYAVRQARAQLAQAQSDYSRALSAVNAAQAGLRSAKAKVSQAQAGVSAAQARVATAQRNVETRREERAVAIRQVDVAQAQIAGAEATLTDARDELTRQRSLYERGAVAERRVVEAETAVRSAESTLAQVRAAVLAASQQVDQAQAAIDAARSQVTEAVNGVDQAQAELAQDLAAVNSATAQIAQAQAQAQTARDQITAAQAFLAQTQRGQRSSAVVVAASQVQAAMDRVAQAQDALNNYTVRSLVQGTVSEVPVEVGDFVPIGGTIANVVSPRELYVQADVDESDIGPIRVGQKAYFTTDAIPNRTYQGVVTQIGASANESTNTYPVEIRDISDKSGLRVNLSVDVNIVTETHPSALLIPASAIVTEPRPHVWIVDTHGRLEQRNITIGARDTVSGRVEVTSGLLNGERVVTNPKSTFRNGQQVHFEMTMRK